MVVTTFVSFSLFPLPLICCPKDLEMCFVFIFGVERPATAILLRVPSCAIRAAGRSGGSVFDRIGVVFAILLSADFIDKLVVFDSVGGRRGFCRLLDGSVNPIGAAFAILLPADFIDKLVVFDSVVGRRGFCHLLDGSVNSIDGVFAILLSADFGGKLVVFDSVGRRGFCHLLDGSVNSIGVVFAIVLSADFVDKLVVFDSVVGRRGFCRLFDGSVNPILTEDPSEPPSKFSDKNLIVMAPRLLLES